MDYAAMDALRMTLENFSDFQTKDNKNISNLPTYVALKNEEIQNSILQLTNNSKSSNNLLKYSNHMIEENESFDSKFLMGLAERAQSCHNLLSRKMPYSFNRISSEITQEESSKNFEAQRIQPAPMLPARSAINLLTQMPKNFNDLELTSDYNILPNNENSINSKFNKSKIKENSLINLNSYDEDYSILSDCRTTDILRTSEKKNVYHKVNKISDDSIYNNFKKIESLNENVETLKNIANKKDYSVFLKNDYNISQKPNEILVHSKERPSLPPKPNLSNRIQTSSLKSGYFNSEIVETKQMKELIEILKTTSPKQLSIWISEEDCQCFNIKPKVNTKYKMHKVFLFFLFLNFLLFV